MKAKMQDLLKNTPMFVLILLNFSYCDSKRVLITVTRTRHMRRPCDFHFMIAMQKFTGKRHLAPHIEKMNKRVSFFSCLDGHLSSTLINDHTFLSFLNCKKVIKM